MFAPYGSSGTDPEEIEKLRQGYPNTNVYKLDEDDDDDDDEESGTKYECTVCESTIFLDGAFRKKEELWCDDECDCLRYFRRVEDES